MKEDPTKPAQKTQPTSNTIANAAPGVSEEMERMVQLKVD
jgi:hypothetical protein